MSRIDRNCQHTSRNVKYVDTPEVKMELEICANRYCAKIFAYCEHDVCVWEPITINDPEYDATDPESNSRLTCTFCGVDGT